jgi:hypothetical protein
MRRGMGFVGAWRFARLLLIATGGTRQQVTRLLIRLAGPPLGVLRRCVRGLAAPASPADSALGNSEGESGWCDAREAGSRRPRRAAPRAVVLADPVTRELFRSETRAVGQTLAPR